MLEPGDRVLVGVSGGPDSIALLHFLHQHRVEYDIELFVVHVHHKLRLEADTEAAFVMEYCKKMQIPVKIFIVDVAVLAKEKGMSLEQAGHEARFSCFREAATEWEITKLALGHHADDRAESILMHIVQGCGLDGLTAMPPKDGWLIRPFAQIPKRELVQYCEIHQLQYFVDETNLEVGCLRNQIRLEVLPQLEKYNPRITDTMLRMQESCTADADYLETCTMMLWKQHHRIMEDAVQFPATIYQQQHIALQRRILRLLYKQLTGSESNLSFRQIEQMQHIAEQRYGSQQIILADHVVFFRRYDWLSIEKYQKRSESYNYFFDLNAKFPVSNLGDVQLFCPEEEVHVQSENKQAGSVLVAELVVPEWNCVFQCLDDSAPELLKTSKEHSGTCFQISVDADKLNSVLQVRSRKPGDRIVLHGSRGHKKLNKFFIDKKVPAMIRNSLPLVVSGEEIIWIPGYFVADCVKITSTTKRCYSLRCLRHDFCK